MDVLPSIDASEPWAAPCAAVRYYDVLDRQLGTWSPSIQIRGADIRELAHQAIRENAEWMIHPCVNALTLEINSYRQQRDFLFAFWVMANTGLDEGEVKLESPGWAWLPNGGFAVAPGVWKFEQLAPLEGWQNENPCEIAIDPWSDSVGICLDAPLENDRVHEMSSPIWNFDILSANVSSILQSISFVQQYVPACVTWMRPVTKVVALLPRLANLTQNWSRQDVPGLVYTTMPHSMLEILDTIVHESAHRYFFLFESIASIVGPRDLAIYRSPLRKDLRPLRGILLAQHAIVYMAALYSAIERTGILTDSRAQQRLERLKYQYEQCLEVVRGAEENLTNFGQSLIVQMEGVAAYAFA